MAEDPQTWEELKTALATWTVREDLTDLIPEAIAYAERTFQRELESPEKLATTTLAFTSESKALPTDSMGVETAYWLNGSVKTLLQQVTVNKLREDYRTSATGTPVVFAIEGENMLLGPPPSSGNVELSYWQKITPLDGSTATNWLLTDHPDLYIAASLAWLFTYAREWDTANEWTSAAAGIMNSVNSSGRKRQTNTGPLAARPSKADNILSYT